ncbi:MAG: lipopolysaccharide heptosyltransferase I [Bradyrhizobiaceae bacterium]|nr:lipopolysaccharide heptosyltransferase I [Bradyrhizobiaceae bacterium]
MTEILFIKTSSMGDVLHHMPAVTDAHRRFPDARITWVVDELYAPLAGLHPAVAEIVPIAIRRWRKRLHEMPTWNEIREATAKLRTRRYDAVIDTQGLVRTALMTKLIHGESHGYDAASIREPFAARFYDHCYPVSWDLHVIARTRTLTGLALGYSPEGAPDYGFDRNFFAADGASPYAILFHATAKIAKEWPEDRWVEVGRSLAARGLEVVLPWGSDRERERSERLAAAIPNARVPDRKPILEVGKLITGAKLVVGVDTGFIHLAAALGVPVVAVFTIAKSHTAIPMGPGKVEMVGAENGIPEVSDVISAITKTI